MKRSKDRILIVESNPEISDFIGRQALSSAGYQVFSVADASSAIAKTLQVSPDLIITNIHLPGLSGKDLMIALSSQGINTPIIVIAEEGKESEVIQTFRLGAVDYFMWPCQEPEIIRSVERIISQIHEHRDRTILEKRLSDINQQLQQRVRELTAIFSMGKAVTSITDQRALFDKINHVAAQVTQADISWFLLREEEKEKKFVLVAQQGLPDYLSEFLMDAWDDGISSLVVMSGEPLSLHGEPIKRFRIKSLGESILIVPIKVQRQVMGILVVMRSQPLPFSDSDQHLMEAVADYASISLVNARLFRAIEARAQALQDLASHAQNSERITQEKLQVVQHELEDSSKLMVTLLDELSQDVTARWNPTQRQNLTQVREKLIGLNIIAETLLPPSFSDDRLPDSSTNIKEIIEILIRRYQSVAKQNKLKLTSELPEFALTVQADQTQLQEVIQGLLANAIQFCEAEGEILIRVAQISNSQAQVDVLNSGVISQKDRKAVFKTELENKTPKLRSAGIGISLALIQQIVKNMNGQVWVDQAAENKTAFHLLLPLNVPKA
ncbi:MAG: hypothetical protein BGO78_07050 [Chloroflexi bacterium 44-23]|nr:MAG: hypothetical protein BGO78_07050 [Chloroflexi bacterium 44-23]